jgi:hypothetical protein
MEAETVYSEMSDTDKAKKEELIAEVLKTKEDAKRKAEEAAEAAVAEAKLLKQLQALQFKQKRRVAKKTKGNTGFPSDSGDVSHTSRGTFHSDHRKPAARAKPAGDESSTGGMKSDKSNFSQQTKKSTKTAVSRSTYTQAENRGRARGNSEPNESNDDIY